MGAQQSVDGGVKVEGIQKPDDKYPAGHFGVSVSGNTESIFQAQLAEAYEAGKQEGLSSVQNTLSQVANQTFESIHNQLSEMQAKQLEQSKLLVITIQRFMFIN